jgi:hypothetical protein
MKTIISLLFILISNVVTAQKNISFSFVNDYEDTYHLSLIIYTPDGKEITRVSNVKPNERKDYSFAEGTIIYVLDWNQEVYAMKGKSIKKTTAKPYLTLQASDAKRVIKLTALPTGQKVIGIPTASTKPNANDALGTWVIDLRPAPDSAAYLKEFKFTRIDGKNFDGEFYGYPFSGGFFNVDFDKLYFAFTTADQRSTYFHSGYIEGDKVYGMTLNEERKFLLPWKGERK